MENNVIKLDQTDIDQANRLITMMVVISQAESLFESLGVKLTDKYWHLQNELKQEEYEMLLSQAILHKNGEAKICAIFDYLAYKNDGLVRNYFKSDITNVHKEQHLETGIVDRVAHHKDGSVTVIEIKGFGSRRDHAQAVGQVLLYAAGMHELKQTNNVNKAIVVLGERDYWIELVCKAADIAYINIPRYVVTALEDCAKINDAILKNELIVNG